MIRYSSEVTIDRSPADVFDALLDPARYAKWTDMVDMRFEGSKQPGVGSTGTFQFAKGPIKGPLEMTVTELDRDRRLVFRITHQSLDWTAVSTLAPDGAGTRLTYAGEIQLRGWRRVLEPIMAGEVSGGEAKEVQRLKMLLEAAPVTAPATA